MDFVLRLLTLYYVLLKQNLRTKCLLKENRTDGYHVETAVVALSGPENAAEPHSDIQFVESVLCV
jgi:hypothetical protein